MGCISISTFLGARCANQRVVGIACIIGRILCSPLSWLASNKLHEGLFTREIGRRCSYHIFLRVALPWCRCIAYHPHIPVWDGWIRAWITFHQLWCTCLNFSLFFGLLQDLTGVFRQPGNTGRLSSKFLLPRSGEPVALSLQQSDTCLFWAFSSSPVLTIDDSSSSLPKCQRAGFLPFCPWLFEVSSEFPESLSSACPLARTGEFCKQVIWGSKYAAIWGSLAWYSPVTCPVTNKESLFANNPLAPISFASIIPAIRASYSFGCCWLWKRNGGPAQLATHPDPPKWHLLHYLVGLMNHLLRVPTWNPHLLNG